MDGDFENICSNYLKLNMIVDMMVKSLNKPKKVDIVAMIMNYLADSNYFWYLGMFQFRKIETSWW